MGIPILTSEGFVGQRWIIDDYFRAGETLHCGDVAVIRGTIPQVYKATPTEERRVIGIVHTPSTKSVGDEAATRGKYVSIVVKGIAKALCTTDVGVGDPVMASGSKTAPTGKTNMVATVVQAGTHNHSPNTPEDIMTGVDDDMDNEVDGRAHTVGTSTDDSDPPPSGPEN